MSLAPDQLDLICGHRRHRGRKVALCRMINDVSPAIHDLRPPHVLGSFLAQVLHESARLQYVREIWGPTPAQRRYEGRRDLGNVLAGDGKRFMGRDIIQITGRANYAALTAWLRSSRPGSPDFEAHPELLEKPEFLGWGALWYWRTRVPARFVEEGDQEMITRRVNGGLNGYRDRLDLYTRSALVLLGHGPEDVREFQADADLIVDGIAGPRTRATLHERLSAMPVPEFKAPRGPDATQLNAPRRSFWRGVFGGGGR